jgi:hypothetical protein
LFSNIFSGNNRLYYQIYPDVNPVSGSLEIPVGHYDVASFAEAFNASQPHMSLTYDITDKPVKYTLTNVSLLPIDIDLTHRSPLSNAIGAYEEQTLGLLSGQSHELSTPDLSGPHVLHLLSPDVASANAITSASVTGGYHPLLETVPNSPNFGFPTVWEANDLVSSDVEFGSTKSLRRVHIVIADSHGNTCHLPEGVEVQLTMKVFYIN